MLQSQLLHQNPYFLEPESNNGSDPTFESRLNKRERKSEEKVGKDMELENLKLYKENMSIIEENKLRKKATLLHQENLALMSELIRKKFSHSEHLSYTLFLLQNPRIK
ncbi:hypothetical protein RHMOL_Rhmol11G0018600 [Rhododendron molle]|uniref:Uncharacterized protein n=1 Tax=Rhododendron molle TaxID=49168 RepID=A0ACC0LMX7_RHOML|nr:hypothetical protein RHMOL_Rhmol11G0018600 [Rhododendron molle]